jgi:hypothetical protein
MYPEILNLSKLTIPAERFTFSWYLINQVHRILTMISITQQEMQDKLCFSDNATHQAFTENISWNM